MVVFRGYWTGERKSSPFFPLFGQEWKSTIEAWQAEWGAGLKSGFVSLNSHGSIPASFGLVSGCRIYIKVQIQNTLIFYSHFLYILSTSPQFSLIQYILHSHKHTFYQFSHLKKTPGQSHPHHSTVTINFFKKKKKPG